MAKLNVNEITSPWPFRPGLRCEGPRTCDFIHMKFCYNFAMTSLGDKASAALGVKSANFLVSPPPTLSGPIIKLIKVVVGG